MSTLQWFPEIWSQINQLHGLILHNGTGMDCLYPYYKVSNQMFILCPQSTALVQHYITDVIWAKPEWPVF